jgi:hypothetical protein
MSQANDLIDVDMIRTYTEARDRYSEWGMTYFSSMFFRGLHNFTLGGALSCNVPELSADEWVKAPARTVVIPVETMTESYTNLSRTLLALRRACQKLGRTEVIVWFNTGLAGDHSVIQPTVDKLETWILELQLSSIASCNFRIRVNHRFRDDLRGSGDFNEIRAAYMDAVIKESYPRHFRFSHPVWWLDADTPFISRNSIRLAEDALTEGRGHFIKTSHQYSGDTNGRPGLSRRSDAEKVAAVYALTRRMLERNLAPTDSRGYVEESGLLMTLGNYILCGGVGLADPLLGESKTMLKRAFTVLDPTVPLVYHINAARIGNSYRRFRLLAATGKAYELANSEEGEDYKDSMAMVRIGLFNPRTDPVVIAEVRELVNRLTQTQVCRTQTQLTASQARRLDLFINRCEFAADDVMASSAEATLI